MRILYRYIFLLLVTVVSLSTSCKDDKISSDSSLRLDYSADTISFDSILSDMLSPVQKLMIYNNTGERLRIDNISISESNGGVFGMNVDGRSGSSVDDIEIESGDSIYVFIQTTGNLPDTDNHLLLEENIKVTYNGNIDIVNVYAFSSRPIILRNVVIEQDTLLAGDRPYLIYDTLRVAEGAKLTVGAGVKFLFHNTAILYVDGSIDIMGEKDNRVKMRYFRSDIMLDGIPYYNIPGNWEGVYLSGKATNSEFHNVDIKGGNYGLVIDSSDIDAGVFILDGCDIGYSNYGALVAENAQIYAYNTVIANGGHYNLRLIGGKNIFYHCTIASCKSKKGSVRKPSVVLENEDNGEIIPIYTEIVNSIIFGSDNQEILMSGISPDSLGSDNFKLYVYYSLINGKKTDNEYLYENKWNEKPMFRNIDNNHYSYDFHIDSLSPARTLAADIYNQFPELSVDKDGKSRVDDFYPDAGAYEF